MNRVLGFFRMPLPVCWQVWVVGCAAALLLSSSSAQGAPRPFSQSLGAGPAKVDLLADRAEYDLDSSWATFLGNVVIRADGQELRADRIRFNTVSHEAKAYGRVTLIGIDGSMWSGDSLEVDLKKRTGSAGDVEVYYKPFRIEAAKGEVVGGVYTAEDVLMTTCTNAPGDYHYQIAAGKLRLRPDNDLTAYDTVTYLFDAPVLYCPYFWKDLHRHYGLRFEPGYRSRWGAYLLSSYKMRLFRDENNRWVDSRTSVDLRSERGVAYGERLNWYMQEAGDGWLSLYTLKDQKDPLPYGVEDPERYRIRLNHSLEVTARDRVSLQGLYVSDDKIMRDFFEREHRDMAQPESYLSYTHTGRDLAFGVIARPRLNDFYDQVERLPEAWLNINQQELGNSGIYYESQNQAAFLRQQYDERKDPLPESYEAGRADSWHRLSLPLKTAGFLNVIPRTGYRGTYYTDSQETWQTEENVTQVETNELGYVTTTVQKTTVDHTRSAGSTYRNLFELGTEVSFKAYGSWDAQDGTIWRHVVEPYSDYTYVPTPNVLPEDLYQFDSIDTLDFQHVVRLGLRNRWQYKKGDRAHEVAMVDVYGDVLLEPEDDQESLDRIVLDSEFRPATWMRWDVDAEYSVSKSELETSSTRLMLWQDRFSTSLEYRYRVDASSLATGSVTWSVTPQWDVNLFGRYEFETALVEELGGYLQRRYDCMALRVYATVLPGYTRSDGTVEEDEYRVSVVAWLTAFPPDSLLESDQR